MGVLDDGTVIGVPEKAVALAMDIAAAVLPAMGKTEPNAAAGMPGNGLACLAITQLPKKE